MWPSPRRASLVLAAALVLCGVGPALASFAGGRSASQAVATGVLQPPTGLAAAVGKCVNNKSVEVRVSWTPSASSFATGYAVWRSDGPGAPMQQVGTAGGGSASAFTDTTVGFSGAYAYEVRALRNNWTSAAAGPVAVTTPAKNCK